MDQSANRSGTGEDKSPLADIVKKKWGGGERDDDAEENGKHEGKDSRYGVSDLGRKIEAKEKAFV